MTLEAELGEALGITEPGTAKRLRSASEEYGLPAVPPAGITADQLIMAADKDKKNRAGELRFSLLEGVGRMARTKSEAWKRRLPNL